MADDIARLGIRIDSIEAKLAEDRLDRLERQGMRNERSNSSLGGSFVKLGGLIAGAAAGVGTFNKLIGEGRNLAIFNASLKTATGSVEAASAQFAILEKFAAETPYTLDQSINGFVKLKNLGLDPSIEALKSYGNTSAAMGKDLNDMIEAIADATTGEFERLKEFGIKAKSEGDNVSFTFQGVTTTIAKNADSIEEYLRGIGEVNFAGAMADRMATLDGALSNLEDSWDSLFRTIMDGNVGGIIETTIRAAIVVIEDLNELLGKNYAATVEVKKPLTELEQATLDYASSWERVEKIRSRVASMERMENPAVQQAIILTTSLLEEEIAVRDKLLQKMKELSDPGVTLEASVAGRGIFKGFDEEMAALQQEQQMMIDWNKSRQEALTADEEMMDSHLELYRRHYEERNNVIQASHRFQMASARNLAENTLEVMRRSGKEQTAAAKAIFLAQKAIDVVQIISATEVAAAKAAAVSAAGGPLPFFATAGAIRAFGYANAAIVAGLGINSAMNMGKSSGGGGGSTGGGTQSSYDSGAVASSMTEQVQQPLNITVMMNMNGEIIEVASARGVEKAIRNGSLTLEVDPDNYQIVRIA